MTDEKPQKQIWTSPSLESLEMKGTANGDEQVTEDESNTFGKFS